MRNTDNRGTVLGVWLMMFVSAAGMVRAGNTCTWNGSWGTTPPTNVDDVIVVSSGGNLTWSNTMPAKVASWSQGSGYSGIVTFQTIYGTTGFTNFTVTGDVTLNGGTWAHQANTSVETNRLRVTVNGNLYITNSIISGDSLGYSGWNGPGKGGTQIGGAHGGAAPGPAPTVNFNTYGSIIAPTNLGSGGGINGSGGKGGGAIYLTVAGTTTVASAGAITANGENNAGNTGGAGGSVYLSTGWLTGSGTIRANGGTGANTAWGGGSGGRVAIILTGSGADFVPWAGGTNTAYGASVGGFSPAAAGTVYRKTQAGVDALIIDNNNVATYGQLSTYVTNALNLNSFSNVVVSHKGILGVMGNTTVDFNTWSLTTSGPTNSYIAIDSDGNVTYPTDWILNGYTLYANSIATNKLTNLTIGTNGVLSHYQNYTAETYKINLTLAGNLTVLSNGAINADTLGYTYINPNGYGPGAGSASIGGAYGGEASGSSPTVNSNTYGSIIAPTNAGSSGGANGGGGGAILLTVAGTTTVASAGVVTANGGTSAGNGGGAGGSIYLTTGWLAGSGTLRANGGSGPNSGWGAGSGGRIAIILTGAGADFVALWNGTNTAFGGSVGGWSPAAAGTVYRQKKADMAGTGAVTVSNNFSASLSTSVPSRLNPGENLKTSSWLLTGYGKIGVTTNVQLGFLTITGANSRVDLKGRVLSVLADLNINGTLYGVGTYRTNDLTGSNVMDTVGNGTVDVRPVVDNANGATNVTQTSAALNGNLYSADSSTALFVLWGAQDAGTNLSQWAHTNSWVAPLASGYFSTNVTSPNLLANTVQYYRFYTTNNTRQNLAVTSSVFMTSDVTVQKTADASEVGLAPGTFTFYRNPAATNGAITVSYSISGSAKSGTNYVNNLGTSINFAQGVSQTNLVVVPLQDDVSQSNETIILTLASGPYSLGSPSVATGIVFNSGIPAAPTNTWIGTGGNASQGANWSLGHPPSNTEYVLLSGFSKMSLVWDVTNPVISWQQTDQYTGIVTFATVYGTNGFTNCVVSGNVILAGGTWSHLANTTTESNCLRVSVGGDLFVSNATINADVLGYGAGSGPGAGSFASLCGGAYGGAARDAALGINSNTYGSMIAPTNVGSGGGGAGGGGAILLTVAGTTTVASAGVITANGGSSVGNGGGAGGSIFLTTGWLAGSGTLRANGGTGAGGNFSGGGSGGRVAMVLTGSGSDFSSLWTGTNTAYGAAGGMAAAAGTVYRKTQAGTDTLIIDNNGLATAGQISTFVTNTVNLNNFSNVVVNHNGILGVKANTTVDFNTLNLTTYGPANSFIAIDRDVNVTYPTDWLVNGYTLYVNAITPNKPVNLTIGTNGALSHYQNLTAETYKLNLTLAGNLTVLSNGVINVDALGYGIGQGPGAGAGSYGGAHGGVALGSASALNPKTYGSIIGPTNIGSGGGAGAGGGAILLTVAGTTTVAAAGTISANSATSAGNGGGAGGSITLTTGWLVGNGTIRANGGNGDGGNASGGGGGGRVALILTGTGADFSLWSGTNSAYGGPQPLVVAAAAGTVYRQKRADLSGAGTVIVDNGSTATNLAFTSLPAFTNSSEVIKQTTWAATNNARIGLVTNTAIAGLNLSSNGVLELANYTLTVMSLTVTNKSYNSGHYGPHDTAISRLTDSGSSGKVIVNAEIGAVYLIR